MTGSSSSENDRARPNLQPATPIGGGKLASWPTDANPPLRQVSLRQVDKLRHIRELQPHIEVQLAEQFSTCRSAGKLDPVARPKKGGKLTTYDESNATAVCPAVGQTSAQRVDDLGSPNFPLQMVNSRAVHAPRRKAKADRLTAFDDGNLTAAAHGGPDSLPVQWARLFLSRHRPERLQGDLFNPEGLSC